MSEQHPQKDSGRQMKNRGYRGDRRTDTRPDRGYGRPAGNGRGPAGRSGMRTGQARDMDREHREHSEHSTFPRTDRNRSVEKREGSFAGNARGGRGFQSGRRNGERSESRFSAPRRPAPVRDGLDPRRVALNVVRAVTENQAWASMVLDRELTKAGLTPQDRRLAARLAYDTIDHLMYLDWVLSQVMAREDTDIKLRNILRLGACQLLLEDRIPDMAATDTSVKLCKELGMEGLAGVCNGILRNLIRKREELVFPDRTAEPMKYLSIMHSVPEFLVRRLVADYGEEAAEKLMSVSGRDMAVTIRPNLMKMDDAQFEKLLEDKVWETGHGMIQHAFKIRNMANLGDDRDFVQGNFSIQSEQSQMACLAVAPKRGWNVVDACAAPGGKSCYLAEMMDGTGRVYAWEVHEHRTRLIEAQMKRLGLENIRPVTRDASVPKPDLFGTMDAVLLDAPCSGTGEMHEKPDSRYRLQEDSVETMIALQQRILEAVAPLVKKGGILVYSTCSVLADENERQVEAFLKAHPEFAAEDLPDTIPEAIRAKRKLGVQLMPGVDADGGFYICRMRRSRI